MTDETNPPGGNVAAPETVSAVATGRDAGRSLSTVFEILSDHRRRITIAYLSESDADVHSFDDVVDHVVRIERLFGERRRDHRDRVTVDVHHHHLPKLIDHGVVEYDPRTETIRYRGDQRLERHLVLAMERP